MVKLGSRGAGPLECELAMMKRMASGWSEVLESVARWTVAEMDRPGHERRRYVYWARDELR